jgi:hypothetical protein
MSALSHFFANARWRVEVLQFLFSYWDVVPILQNILVIEAILQNKGANKKGDPFYCLRIKDKVIWFLF